MPRRRTLSPEFFSDEDLSTLPFEARLLYAGLWCYADRDGRLEDRPKYLKAMLFPYDRVDVEKLLNLLANPQIQDRPEKVFVRRYQADGKQLIDIPGFSKHQKPHPHEPPSVYPDMSLHVTASSDNGIPRNDTPTLHRTKNQEPRTNDQEPMTKDQPPDTGPVFSFDEFWDCYPKKVDKQESAKLWQRLNPDDDLQAAISTGLCRAQQTAQWRESDGKYIPSPARWLRQRKWEDEVGP